MEWAAIGLVFALIVLLVVTAVWGPQILLALGAPS